MRYLLLTGASGLIGQSILMELLRCRIPVAALVRGTPGASPTERIDSQLACFENKQRRLFPRPVVLEGDLRSERLGLSQADMLWLERNCGSVLHCAANLSFRPAAQHPGGEPLETNVGGTQRLLEVCRQTNIQEFHYVSTAYVCGTRTGVIFENEGSVGQSFANDYEMSKLTSEQNLRSAISPGKLTVYRPSIVVGTDSSFRITSDRTLYLAFSMYQLIARKFGLLEPSEVMAALGLNGRESKNIVSAAWVARMICQIFRRPQLHGETFHLTHPTGTPVSRIVRAFREVLARQQYPPAQLSPETQFAQLDPSIAQFVETFAPYFRDDPQFDRTQLLRAMRSCDEHDVSDIDDATLQLIASQPGQQNAITLRSQSPNRFDLAGLESTDDLPTLTRLRCRLALIGPMGGESILHLRADGRVLRERANLGPVDVAAYLSTKSWSELLRQQRTISDLFQCGALTLEAERSPSDFETLIRRFDQIVSGVRRSSDILSLDLQEADLHAE